MRFIRTWVRTLDELAQECFTDALFCCIIEEIKGTTMEDRFYPDEMFEEAERREKSNRILQRYNDFHNLETSGLPHGTPITPEHQQIIAMESMIDAIRCEYLNREYNHIAIEDIEGLVEGLRDQADEFLERVKTLSANVETPENTEND